MGFNDHLSRNDNLIISARLLGGLPLLRTSRKHGQTVLVWVATGRIVSVSLPLVSVTLKSCQFKTCSKPRTRVTSAVEQTRI